MQTIIKICMGILFLVQFGFAHADENYDRLSPQTKQQIDCLTENIYFEARNQSIEGHKAIAFVTINRSRSDKFPSTICGVVKQKRITCQFSWHCNINARDRYVIRQKDKDGYRKARTIAMIVYFNYHRMYDITKGSIFFHKVNSNPKWRHNLVKTVKLGDHIFYRIPHGNSS